MIPVRMETDVLVLGGGSAGLCSAMAAREAGASVMRGEWRHPWSQSSGRHSPDGKSGVWGQIAGTLVAEESRAVPLAETISWSAPDRCAQGAEPDPMTAAFLRVGKQKVRHILWTCGGVLRNSEGLS